MTQNVSWSVYYLNIKFSHVFSKTKKILDSRLVEFYTNQSWIELQGSSSKSTFQDSLYDPNLLTEIKLDDWPTVSFDPPIAIDNPGENLCLRPLRLGDYENGFPTILSQLTEVGTVSKEQFLGMLKNILISFWPYSCIVLKNQSFF